MREGYRIESALRLVSETNYFSFHRFSEIEDKHSYMINSKYPTKNVRNYVIGRAWAWI